MTLDSDKLNYIKNNESQFSEAIGNFYRNSLQNIVAELPPNIAEQLNRDHTLKTKDCCFICGCY